MEHQEIYSGESPEPIRTDRLCELDENSQCQQPFCELHPCVPALCLADQTPCEGKAHDGLCPQYDLKCLYEINKGHRCPLERDEGDAEYCEHHRLLSNIFKECVFPDLRPGKFPQGNWF